MFRNHLVRFPWTIVLWAEDFRKVGVARLSCARSVQPTATVTCRANTVAIYLSTYLVGGVLDNSYD